MTHYGEDGKYHHTSETKEKIRRAHLGKHRSEETRKRMSEGRKRSGKHRQLRPSEAAFRDIWLVELVSRLVGCDFEEKNSGRFIEIKKNGNIMLQPSQVTEMRKQLAEGKRPLLVDVVGETNNEEFFVFELVKIVEHCYHSGNIRTYVQPAPKKGK